MLIEHLTVCHLLKSGTEPKPELGDTDGIEDRAFHCETCQRHLWIGDGQRSCHFSDGLDRAIEIYSGESAYCFLLRVTCGLESAIVGETDVFGQLKCAWNSYESRVRSTARALFLNLLPWIQRVFSDTKRIRREHLEGVGGVSYGSLVRKLVAPGTEDSVLVVGAGQLAQSVIPYLTKTNLWLWNRNKKRLSALAEAVRRQDTLARITLVSDDALPRAFECANHVVLCVPPQGTFERPLFEARMKGRQRGILLHLGGFQNDIAHWNGASSVRHLGHVLSLQATQNEIREARIRRAKAACAEMARVRTVSLASARERLRESRECFT